MVAALLLAGGLGGCVYAPPYAYDSAYPGYHGGYPGYAGPPVSLDLGFNFYDRPRYPGNRHHGWRHHGDWPRHHGGYHHRGGWGYGRGRH